MRNVSAVSDPGHEAGTCVVIRTSWGGHHSSDPCVLWASVRVFPGELATLYLDDTKCEINIKLTFTASYSTSFMFVVIYMESVFMWGNLDLGMVAVFLVSMMITNVKFPKNPSNWSHYHKYIFLIFNKSYIYMHMNVKNKRKILKMKTP
jgi:hypothetical protein